MPSTIESSSAGRLPGFGDSSWGRPGKDPLIGVRLGNYRVLSLLGSGHFGKVLKAEDTALGRLAAIKFLNNPMDAQHRRLFEREAKALAALGKHPNIVSIYEWGTHEDKLYFVLEYVEASAVQLLREHPGGLPVPEALRIAAECAEALEEAHGNGILHRDVKPANILIEGGSNTAKVSDFGLARFRESSEFTLAGSVSGSPPYMSPEQARGVPVDRRSDVFSLGVTLYEFLSGRRPFEAETVSEILEQVRNNRRVPLCERRPDLPKALLSLVDRATAFDPAERYQTAGDLARHLRSALERMQRHGHLDDRFEADTLPTPSTRLAPRGRRRLLGMAAAGAAAIAVIAAVGFALRPHGDARPPGADARALLDAGSFTDAEAAFRAELASDPASEALRAGRALALIKLGRIEEAAEILSACGSAPDCAEGRVLLAYAANDASLRSLIETAQPAVPAATQAIVAAKLALESGDLDTAVARLSAMGGAGGVRAWERSEAQLLLGTAQYQKGDLVAAREAFSSVSEYERSPIAVARAYLGAIDAQQATDRSAEVLAAAQRIRDLAAGGAADVTAAPADSWTSRPLDFFVLPPEVGTGRFAVETGLPAVLPQMLEDVLAATTPMRPVDRTLLSELLREQELSALLGSPGGRLALGKVLGARLIVQCRFGSLGGAELITVRADDTETTARQQIEEVPVAAGRDAARDVIDRLAASIWTGVRPAYPLQGRVYRGDGGLKINLGAEVGLKPGMVFDVYSDPGDAPIDGAAVRVLDRVGGSVADAAADGIAAESIPADAAVGLYVRERAGS